MNLLLRRSQSSYKLFKLLPLLFGSGVIFNLHAEVQFEPDELELIRKYHLEEARIYDGNMWPAIRDSIFPALIAAVITYVPFYIGLLPIKAIFGIGGSTLTLFGIIFAGWLFAHFWDKYENLRIADLMNGGRTFRCDGVVSLIHREDKMDRVCMFVKQVLESAKQWHDREAKSIPALSREEARRLILTAKPI